MAASEGKGSPHKKVDQCYICKNFLFEESLQPVEIKDQGGGYITKLVCGKCIDDIETNSLPDRLSAKESKPKRLLMEEEDKR
jgi:hypothetical protein